MLSLNKKEFGHSNAFMNSNYINYLLKDICRTNIITEQEKKIIKSAKTKLYFFHFLNFCFFTVSLRKVYRVSSKIDFTKSKTYWDIPISVGIMLIIYSFGQYVYYNDLKYLILKYTSLDQDRYINALVNKAIIKDIR
jgi:hypothetical protein